MTIRRVAIGADHAGFEMKEMLKTVLTDQGYEVLDCGTVSAESVDYPDYGYAVARAVGDGEVERGVVVCGTGIGIGIAANRDPRVRAAVCHDSVTARLSRQHNDANVLALGARVIGTEVARECLEIFLATPFEAGRHQARVDKLARSPFCK